MNYYKKLLITLFLSANTFAFANINMPHATMVQDDEDTEKEADGSDDFAESTAEFEALFKVTGEERHHIRCNEIFGQTISQRFCRTEIF